ncbi:MAG: SRPBCC family protein [Cytophagales bacterium]|nr:SRPBCC family protein [Armatimonadota bacterium]
MPDYESSLPVNASPEAVFDFISDISNMPQYLPTTHHAEPQGEGRVRVQGEAAGHPYDSDGWIRLDRTEFRMEWGSDGENHYSGWMEVEGDDRQSIVTVGLAFAPKPEQDARFEQQMGDRDATIRDGLNKALESIKNILEGKGGKVEPAAAT